MTKKRSYVQLIVGRAADKRRLFDQLISKLVADYGIKDRAGLEETINDAGMAYDGMEYWAHEEKRWPNTLWELAAPLDRVIHLLYQEGNRHGILQALGSDETAENTERAVDRHEELLRDMGRIRLAIPSPPKKRPKGKPSQTRDLHELVDWLAIYWERETCLPFKQAWVTVNGKRVPASRGSTAFVYDVVEFLDCKRLRSLPKVTERIVAERRAATSHK